MLGGPDLISTQHVGGRQRIARNQRCPCGSGKKYKRCCGKGPSQARVSKTRTDGSAESYEEFRAAGEGGAVVFFGAGRCGIGGDRFSELYEELKAAREGGTIGFFAAGNYGPKPDSMNVFARSPDVISVGASSLDGRTLCDYSSRGVAGVPDSGPTVVAPGLAVFRLDLVPQVGRSAKKIASDELRLGRRMARHYTIRRGTSFSSATITGLSTLMQLHRDRLGLPSDFRTVKRILRSIALPMAGYESWEMGAGFVNDYVVRQYLKKLVKSSGKEYWPSAKDKRWWRLKMDVRFHLRAIQKVLGMVVALVLIVFGFILLYKGLGTGFHAFIEYKGLKATLLNAAPGIFLVLCGTVLAGIILWRREVISTDQLELTAGGRMKRSSGITIQEMDDD